jgi:hypothetical protein
MLAMVYCVNGVEHARYHHAVKHIMGRGGAIGVTVFQLTNIFLITIACEGRCCLWGGGCGSPSVSQASVRVLVCGPYPGARAPPTDTITGALSLKTIANDACQINGIAPGDCFNQSWKLTLIFSASEVILSQVGRAAAVPGSCVSVCVCGRGETGGARVRARAATATVQPLAIPCRCPAWRRPGGCPSSGLAPASSTVSSVSARLLPRSCGIRTAELLCCRPPHSCSLVGLLYAPCRLNGTRVGSGVL